MSRPHREPATVETLALVPFGRRKALRFGLTREGGRLRGQIEHVGLTPEGRAVGRPHAQRIVLSEPVAMQIVEALARVGVRLREGGK